MASFESIFPTFLTKCAELHTLMQAVAFALFVVGLMMFVGHGFSRKQLFRYLIRLTLLTSLLVFLPQWGNTLQTLLHDSILSGLGVDPSDVYQQYTQLVAAKQPVSGGSWWDIISNVRSAMIESMMTGALLLIGWAAWFIMWWAYIFQKIILHLGYALSPVLIGFMAVHSLKHTGTRYLMNLTGVLLWPLGWAVAALVTQAILDFMTDPTFKVLDPTSSIYKLQNEFGVGVLGFWIIFSTFAAPIVIHKVFVYGALAGSELLSGAARSAIQTATAAVSGAVAAAPHGPITSTAAAATAGALTMLSTASETGYAGSIVAAATGLRPPQKSDPDKDKDSNNDLTGERAVRRMLAQTRDHYAEPPPFIPKSNSVPPFPRHNH
jgi:hypothetical protein